MRKLKLILISVYVILVALLLANLKSCDKQEDKSLVNRARGVGDIGELKVTLLWDFQGDVDLHVKQPDGETIYYQNTRDPESGGYLDVDNLCGGSGAAENIYWEKAPHGVYQVKVKYYGHSQLTGRADAGVCSVVVFQYGKEPQLYKVEMRKVGDEEVVADIVY